MPINTNFSISPYFDDYVESKNFYKILFRPSTAIQARELNQMQTILQKQIERFGTHVFKDGSIVLPGQFDLQLKVPYVKCIVDDIDTIDSFLNTTIVGQKNGVKAVVTKIEYDVNLDLHVFYLRYTDGGVGAIGAFVEDEQCISSSNAALTMTTISDSPTGFGSLFSIGSGVIYTKGFFAAFPKQTIIVDKYDNTPTAAVGFKVEENLITDLQDETLLDNALGSYNENAPGAHRFSLDPVLTVKNYDAAFADPDFVLLLTLRDGNIEEYRERSQYNIIYDEFAKRTFDESGDYYVRGLNCTTREHLDNGENEGLYTANNGGDGNKLSIEVDPGLAYVKGYEVNNLSTKHIVVDKAVNYKFINSQTISGRSGGYFFINQITGVPALDQGTVVNLYNTAETRLTSNKDKDNTALTTAIGTARVKAMVYESGVIGTPSCQYRLYLYDINMSSGSLSDARAVGIASTFFADIVTTTIDTVTRAVFNGDNNNLLLFPIGSNYTRTIRSESGSPDTTFTFYRTESKNINFGSGSGGNVSITVSTPNEDIGFGDGTLTAAEKRQIIFSVSTDTDIVLDGTVSGSGSTITGSGTAFTRLQAGDRIKVNGNYYFINTTPVSATSLQVVGTLSGSVGAGNTIYRSYLAGDIVDLTSKGSDGSIREATVSGTTLSIGLHEDNSKTGTVAASVTYPVTRSSAVEITKTLNPNRYVKINCTGFSKTQLKSAINLGLPDVYKIRNIWKKTSAFTAEGSTSQDVTDNFVFDNGQRDNLYDHARIIPKSSTTLANTDYLLIKLDHFVSDFSTGFGFFSVDSYPIDDTQSSNTTIFTYQIPKYISSAGYEFNLRDTLDFRPYKANTADSATTVTAATTNPAYSNTGTLSSGSNGLRIPITDSLMYVDYSYYLPRKDVVVIDKDGTFSVVKGQSAEFPRTPFVPSNLMGLSNIYIAPYPSISETLARVLKTQKDTCISTNIANIRYTMRDIGLIKDRVDTLDYYNALNLLEKQAKDLKVLDDQGLDRFKNGFFVDGFIDHSLGATDNADYNIAVDKKEKVIRPVFNMDSFGYSLIANTNVQKTGNLLTLPYTETALVDQKAITSIRNIEQSIYRFIGVMELTPAGDTWCDTTTVDKLFTIGDTRPTEVIMTTEWGSWQTYSTGYNLYDRNMNDTSGVVPTDPKYFLGSYTSYAAALQASKSTPRRRANGQLYTIFGSSTDDRALIETITTESRTGVAKTIDSTTQTQSVGNFVTDVSVQPYIRPQVISIYVKGLKARTKYYTFFDGEDMSSYVVYKLVPENGDVLTSTLFSSEGETIVSDDFGQVVCYLRIPTDGKRFRVGTKEIKITDSPTNSIDATSYSEANWTAIGISAQKQNTILSTQIPIIKETVVTETRKKQVTEITGPSCMAYSFKVDVPPGEEGVFLTSAEVYIESMHPTLGFWVEIREMIAGGITRNQVPYSEVWLKRDDARINLNPFDDLVANPASLTSTVIDFPSPVFLYNDTEYAFVIHTEGLNPDTYFYISRLGETDLLTGSQVTSRKLTGTLYTTNNNLNYDIVPDVDLTIKFNRALFTIGSVGSAILGNKPTEFLQLKSGADNFARIGDSVVSSDRLTVNNATGGSNTISVGDILTGSTSGKVGNVVGIVSGSYYTDGFGFVNTEVITVANSLGGNKFINSAITTVNNATGILKSYNSTNNIMIIDDSSGTFFANGKIKAVISNNTAVINAFSSFPYSTTNIKPAYLVFNATTCTFEERGTYSANSTHTEYQPAFPDNSSDFDEEVTLLSRVNEISIYGASGQNSSSASLRASLRTDTEYLSPVIDLSRGHAVYVHNIVNNSDPSTNALMIHNILNISPKNILANTAGFSNTDDTLLISSANSFYTVGDKVYYSVPSGNTPISPLTGNTYYYVSLANTTAIQLANTLGGSSIDIVDTRGAIGGEIHTLTYTIQVNDMIISATDTAVNASVISIIDDEYLLSNTGSIFTYGETITVANSSGGDKFMTATIGPIQTSESGVAGGNLINKYISKNITLANGQDAEDLNVYLTVYKPVDTDVKVWVKLKNGEDSETLSQKQWIELVYNDNFNSSTINKGDFIDLLYSIPDAYMNNGIFEYLSDGVTYSTFKQYAIKIGLFASNSARVPRVTDLRTIALQK